MVVSKINLQTNRFQIIWSKQKMVFSLSRLFYYILFYRKRANQLTIFSFFESNKLMLRIFFKPGVRKRNSSWLRVFYSCKKLHFFQNQFKLENNLEYPKTQIIRITKPNWVFCEFLADSSKKVTYLLFFCFFVFFDRSDKNLTCSETCLSIPETCRRQTVRLPIAHFGLVMSRL